MDGFLEREMHEFDFECLQHMIHSVVFLQSESRNVTDGTHKTWRTGHYPFVLLLYLNENTHIWDFQCIGSFGNMDQYDIYEFDHWGHLRSLEVNRGHHRSSIDKNT